MGRGRDQSRFATVIPVQIRVDNRVVGGGQVRVFPGAGHAHEDDEVPDEDIHDSGGPLEPEQRWNVPGAQRCLTISKIVMQISKGYTL